MRYDPPPPTPKSQGLVAKVSNVTEGQATASESPRTIIIEPLDFQSPFVLQLVMYSSIRVPLWEIKGQT